MLLLLFFLGHKEVTPYHHHYQYTHEEILLVIKAEQRMENTQGLNRRQLAREQRVLRCRRERKLQGLMSYERSPAY